MSETLEIARSLGLGGLGLLAAVLSVKLAVQVVYVLRTQQERRNSNCDPKLPIKNLRLVCPLSPATHSLDNIHEVLVEIRSGMERLNQTQKELVADTKDRSQWLNDLLSSLRLELARRKG